MTDTVYDTHCDLYDNLLIYDWHIDWCSDW